jgi:excisionase family DNA binding protein
VIIIDGIDPTAAAFVVMAIRHYAPTHRANGCSVPADVNAIREVLLRSARVVVARPQRDSTGQEHLIVDMPVEASHSVRMTAAMFDLDDVATDLRLSRRAVQRLIARGDLLAVHVGRSVRVRRVDLDAYIDSLGRGFRNRSISKDAP